MDLSRYAARLAELPTALSTRSTVPEGKVTSKKIPLTFASFDPALFAPIPAQEMLEEPEDAHLTGGTRSLSRRLLALNIPSFCTPQVKAAKESLRRKPGILKPVSEG